MIVSKHDGRTNTNTSTASGKGQIRRPGMYELDYAKMGARIRQFRKAGDCVVAQQTKVPISRTKTSN